METLMERGGEDSGELLHSPGWLSKSSTEKVWYYYGQPETEKMKG